MFERNRLFIFSLIIILITLNTSFLLHQEQFLSTGMISKMEDINVNDVKQSANNDTIAHALPATIKWKLL